MSCTHLAPCNAAKEEPSLLGVPDAQTSVLGMQALEPMYDTQTQL